ncbi:MAG: TraR/DksA C4-type zinc finger protein [Verrucomicrobiota bacterium]|nr:TraR/DksA C4-type zinc finger protein [Verrucomicrobiota bacterium]
MGADNLPKATTEQVLGSAHSNLKIPAQWQQHYARLDRLRERALRFKEELKQDIEGEDPTAAHGLHMADMATDQYDEDFAWGMLSGRQEVIYEIEQAMDRIKNGSYGICEITGKPIPLERLDAIPWTRFSLEAEKGLEERGETDRMQLGQVDRITRNQTARSIGQTHNQLSDENN